MTKADIISQIVKKTELDRSEVSTCLETFISVVKDSMADGNNIYIRGFGSFINKKRARKVARDLSRNQSIIVEEHFIPKFLPGREFKDRIKESKKDSI
jgi:DNA-binding protein HU-beta